MSHGSDIFDNLWNLTITKKKLFSIHFPVTNSGVLCKCHVRHNSKVSIRIHKRYLQITLKFAKCEPRAREEENGLWIMA